MNDDLISRQAVTDLIMENDPWWCDGMTRTIFDGINRLPSVDAVPVIRCKDCIFNRAKDWVDCFNNGMFGRTTDNFCSRGEKRKNDT